MTLVNIDNLTDPFRDKVLALREDLSFELLIYCAGRSAWTQAKLYRQSRSIKTIEEKIASLEKYGHEQLAKILTDVGPQFGPHATRSGPGESWHQYWRAIDAVPLVNGKLALDPRKYPVQWRELGEKAMSLSINWGGNWPKWSDYHHFQATPTSNPLKLGLTGCILSDLDL